MLEPRGTSMGAPLCPAEDRATGSGRGSDGERARENIPSLEQAVDYELLQWLTIRWHPKTLCLDGIRPTT
eukprot:5906173-Heterocapsa_arctica.AAC.1